MRRWLRRRTVAGLNASRQGATPLDGSDEVHERLPLDPLALRDGLERVAELGHQLRVAENVVFRDVCRVRQVEGIAHVRIDARRRASSDELLLFLSVLQRLAIPDYPKSRRTEYIPGFWLKGRRETRGGGYKHVQDCGLVYV